VFFSIPKHYKKIAYFSGSLVFNEFLHLRPRLIILTIWARPQVQRRFLNKL
jgi:hypothetical protein